MFNVRLAGGHLYGKQLFTWLSLVVSFMASFVLSFFPLDVLDGIWDLIEQFLRDFLPTFVLSVACSFGEQPFQGGSSVMVLHSCACVYLWYASIWPPLWLTILLHSMFY